MAEVEPCFPAAVRLNEYLVDAHWRDHSLVGPDPGIRFNYRIGRFLKSYLHRLPWKDDLYYLQGQGYWVLGNWELFDRTGDAVHAQRATACAHNIVSTQCDDGGWMYPNREWEGRVATVEGIWASMALMESYRRTGDERLIEAVRRWHKYLLETIGFQRFGSELAINYFAHKTGPPVPNNSADALRFLSMLAHVTGDESVLEPCRGVTAFLQRAQKPTGEFPYLASRQADTPAPQPHFQCYQYNAFMCDGMMRYFELTRDSSVMPMITRVLEFLDQGVRRDGAVDYACGVGYRHVTYHAAVLAATFARAGQLGVRGYEDSANRVFTFVLSRQRADGSFVYSTGDYRILSDRRSYPRYLAMMMYHLLQPGSKGLSGSRHLPSAGNSG